MPKMAQSPILPTTGAPNPNAFAEAYRTAIKHGATGIISMHISGALSGTLNVAASQAEIVTAETKVPIHILDSRTVSAGFGLPAILASKFARTGASLDEVVTYTQSLLDRGRTFFLLDTLENLQKGGRIGRASAIFGTMLSIKPILAIKDGLVVPLERVRSRSKALVRIGELLRDIGPIDYMALAASDDQSAADLLEVVRPIFPGDIEMFKLGAVIGTHAGPHAAGLFVTPKQA